MKSCQAYDGPDTEETDNADYDAGRGVSHCVQKVCLQLKHEIDGSPPDHQ